MSVTILDIMHLPSLQEARIVAGMNGINRSIASVSVLEAAAAKDLDIDLPGHATNYGQEIILTAFVAYRDSVDAQCEAIHALHKEGEAGIIIFYVGSILPSIDPRVIDLANELEMPIIVMPEGRLDLRYSDVICEIMEAIINDRRENSYFTTEVIERISHLGTSQRSINNALAIIRDRVQCSIYLMDELGRMLNMAEWPNGRNLPAGKFYTTFTNDTTLITGVQEVHIDGKTYLADIETIQSTGSILYMLVVKEKGSLTQESCKQIKYIIRLSRIIFLQRTLQSGDRGGGIAQHRRACGKVGIGRTQVDGHGQLHIQCRVAGLILGVNRDVIVPLTSINGGHGQGHKEGIAGAGDIFRDASFYNQIQALLQLVNGGVSGGIRLVHGHTAVLDGGLQCIFHGGGIGSQRGGQLVVEHIAGEVVDAALGLVSVCGSQTDSGQHGVGTLEAVKTIQHTDRALTVHQLIAHGNVGNAEVGKLHALNGVLARLVNNRVVMQAGGNIRLHIPHAVRAGLGDVVLIDAQGCFLCGVDGRLRERCGDKA